MNDAKSKETQQELFEQFSDSPKKPERFPGLARTQKPILISTNTEQLLMAGILAILLLCGVFFLGVVRGKALSNPILQPPSTNQPSAEVRRPASVPPVRVAASVPASPRTATAPVPEVSPAATMPAAGSVAEKPYTIQLVTHRKKELAEGEMNGLRGRGFYSFIIPSGEYFQVCVGQYGSKDEAKKDLSRFTSKYKDCFLRRR